MKRDVGVSEAVGVGVVSRALELLWESAALGTWDQFDPLTNSLYGFGNIIKTLSLGYYKS